MPIDTTLLTVQLNAMSLAAGIVTIVVVTLLFVLLRLMRRAMGVPKRR